MNKSLINDMEDFDAKWNSYLANSSFNEKLVKEANGKLNEMLIKINDEIEKTKNEIYHFTKSELQNELNESLKYFNQGC